MPGYYFISDAHLGLASREIEREKESQLIAFIKSIAPKAKGLYIVGDLFDAWFEYRTVIPKGYHRLFSALEDLTRSGVSVDYFVGNHDFWIRDYFQKELGMRTHHDPCAVELCGKKVYIHHGDGVANNDMGYRILKKILRNRISVWLYTWLHPDIGLALARSSSKKSRNYTSQKDYGEEDGMMQFARAKIEDGFDIVIMGHRHSPVSKNLGNGTYINLGDWISHYTYAELNDNGITLKHWNHQPK